MEDYELKVSIKKNLDEKSLTSVTYIPLDVTDEEKWIEFDFTDIALNVGETYFIELSTYDGTAGDPGSEDNECYGWGLCLDNDSYPYGEPYASKNHGITWYVPIDQNGVTGDCCFKTYGKDNECPNKPSRPSGQTSGAHGKEYSYSCISIDTDGDQLWYFFDWGDGNNSDWFGPFNSGIEVDSSYIWASQGDYEVRVKSKDVYGTESDWSDPLYVSMPKNKKYIYNPFLNLFENHPDLFPLLR
jgi:hypothetical protein